MDYRSRRSGSSSGLLAWINISRGIADLDVPHRNTCPDSRMPDLLRPHWTTRVRFVVRFNVTEAEV